MVTMLSTASAEQKSWLIENQHLQYRLTTEGERLVGRHIENRLTGKAFSLPAEEFRLVFLNGSSLRSGDCRVQVASSRQRAELLFKHESGVEVRVRYTLPAGKAYLRKQIAVRQRGSTERRLIEAVLENWSSVAANWDSMRADRHSYGSHPIYCEDFWVGVECVAAFNQKGPEGFVLRSRPGGAVVNPNWLELHSTVVGVAERNDVRNAFLRYIEDIRLAPARMVACYNSWWTAPKRFNEQSLLDLAAELKHRLADKHDVFFDVMAIDAGWSQRDSIWEVSRQDLPRGFGPLRRVVNSAHGELGLWISPSAFYPLATDCDWAKRNGFTTVEYAYSSTSTNRLRGISLADPVYLEKTKHQLRRLITDNHFAHVKFDGLIPLENTPHHGLLSGEDSVEPLVTRALELLTAARKANPQIETEPTFLNSWFTYISPWMIAHADSLFGNAGGDYPRAMGPAPDYRESCTSSREWYVFSSLNEVWLPQNALQYFDIIHCDAADGLANHIAMAVGRGRFFLPVYVNPKFISDTEWGQFAGWLRWMRANRELLRQTTVLPSRVELGEPYAYAHWRARRGVVVIRNPSNESKSYVLNLRAAGTPQDLVDAVAYSQYPHRRGIATGLTGSSAVAVRLQPWELTFVEIVPRSQLKEPIAIGARWYRDARGKMLVAPAAGVREISILQPGGRRQTCVVKSSAATHPAGRVNSLTAKLTPKDEWLKLRSKPVSSADFDLQCSVSVPAGNSGKVLLLVEFPGRQHFPSTCTATVNGGAVPLEERSSANQMGYSGGTHGFDPKSYWAGQIPYMSEWTWYLTDVKAGESTVRFTGRIASPDAKIGLWLWSDLDRRQSARPFPLSCPVPEMPQHHDQIERQGICLRQPQVVEKGL